VRLCLVASKPTDSVISAPHAIVSNSDHLQAQTALAAAYFGLPAKDWRSAMRQEQVPHAPQAGRGGHRAGRRGADRRRRASADGLRYPVVLKPAEGVASEDVVLVASPEELAEQSARILARRPGETLFAEEYLPGELRTLETLGDGKRTWVLGGTAARAGSATAARRPGRCGCAGCTRTSRAGLTLPRRSPRRAGSCASRGGGAPGTVAGGTHHLRTPAAKGHDQPFAVLPGPAWPHGWAARPRRPGR
jgi:hypothetical protein